MSEESPPLLPPGAVPPRPDGPASSRTLFAAFFLVLVVAAVLGTLAVTSLLRPTPDPAELAAGSRAPSSSAAPTAPPSPTPASTARPKVDGSFKFLERVGGGPVRWDPCETITYAVNTRGATSSVRLDLKEALSRVTRATGIQFRSVGTTKESFIRAYSRMRYRGVIRKAALILIWVDHDDYQAILRLLRDPRPSIAFAKTMAGLYANQDQYFGGIVVMDADATASRGFGHRYAHGSVLLHELGHIMGLDHVKDPEQLMYSGHHTQVRLRGFGPGDLDGLRRLGREAGCLD
jgi:hypothetical protein